MSKATTALTAPAAAGALTSLADYLQLGEVLAKSGLFPDVRSAAQAVIKILAGKEMGFGPIASMADVHIIEGKPSVGAHLKASAIKRSGKYDYRIVRCDAAACEVEFSEKKGAKWETLGAIAVTMQEANERGWTASRAGKDKSNWQRFPDDMLFARAISKGYRRYCPDLTGGVLAYDPDELDAGPVIEVASARVYDDANPQQALAEVMEGAPAAPPTNGAAKPAPHDVRKFDPQPAPAARPEDAPADSTRLDRVDALVRALNLSPAKVAERLRDLGYPNDWHALTMGQAADVIDRLEKAQAARKAGAAAAAPAKS